MEKDCLKESGGSVKSVPADFRPDIEDDRERKKEYLRFARESIRSSKNYQDWLDADCTLFLPADVAKMTRKLSTNIQTTKSNWCGKDQGREISLMPKRW